MKVPADFKVIKKRLFRDNEVDQLRKDRCKALSLVDAAIEIFDSIPLTEDRVALGMSCLKSASCCLGNGINND